MTTKLGGGGDNAKGGRTTRPLVEELFSGFPYPLKLDPFSFTTDWQMVVVKKQKIKALHELCRLFRHAWKQNICELWKKENSVLLQDCMVNIFHLNANKKSHLKYNQ